MKKSALFLAFIIMFSNVSEAFVTREITVISEKIIPFTFVSEDQYLEEEISIKGFDDLKIKDMYVDNGEMTADVSGNYIEMTFSDGDRVDSYKVINRVDSIELSNTKLSDESKKIIVISPPEEVKSIRSVSGDFESAKVNSDGDIEITVKSSAEGVMSYDEEVLTESLFTVSVSDENMNRECESTIILPHEVQGDVVPKGGDISAVQDISISGNEVTVTFDDGVPVANENIVKSGYTFFWVDRSEDGLFKPYNPNSVYSADVNKITGDGEYIGENEFDEIGVSVYNENWTDYCGIEKNGVRYIYTFDDSKGIPKAFLGSLTEEESISFTEQNFNSEKYTVNFSNAGVSYVPEGKLYSMGELVPGTAGWGETEPNRDWESKKTFFNELSGKYETYVKHFKFFYGPKEKTTFGGYYTYPYSCTLEYQHYKPVACYSGNVVYEYESNENIKGYSYNGWIKAEYTAEKEINDYPPTAPINVRYNSFSGDIVWGAGSDDYTEKAELKYEVQIFDGEWKTVTEGIFEELTTNYMIDYSEPDVRIRTVDEVGQFSDWTYASKSSILLTGELKPYVVNPGDNIDISALTKSAEKIQSVIAKNDELQMYTELQKLSESVPDFVEISYDIEADFPEDTDEYMIVSGRVATGNKTETDTYKFEISEEFDGGSVSFGLTEDIKMSENGTVIFSNLNSDDIPVDMFYYNSKTWFAGWNNKVCVKNKITGKGDILFKIESGTATHYVNYRDVVVPEYTITINTFEFDENGNPVYEYLEADKNYLSAPIALTWNTDVSGVTEFRLYLGTEVIYTYEANWEDINKHVDNFSYIYMYKQLKKFSKATYGYITPSKSERAKWNKIVLSIARNYDLRTFPWLGYRVRNNEYVKQQYVDEYNADPNVRNNYRLFICNDSVSENAIKRYTDILKLTNTSMTSDKDTIFGDDALEYTSAFGGFNLNIPEYSEPGTYEIDLVAADVSGNEAEIKLTLIIQDSELPEEDKSEENIETSGTASVNADFFGRFFFKDGKGYLESLKKTETTDGNGFICAGETLGFYLVADNTEYIEIDFGGDESIKTMDSLTERFLIDIPVKNGKDIADPEYMYTDFPKKIYPQYVDNSGMAVFKHFYVIPYGTGQTLESWSSLKSDTLENIDTERLFERITEPYSLIIYPNGDRKQAVHLHFDVFERWDTVLNRDVTEYVINSDTRWEMRIDK